MRRLVIAFIAFSLSISPLSAQRHRTPFEYGHTVAVSLQGGPLVFVGEYTKAFKQNKEFWRVFAPHAELALSYFISDGRSIRTSLSYSKKSSVLSMDDGYYPYTFNAAHLFVDYVVDFYRLGEYYVNFSPMLYVGAGVAHSFGFSDSGHPDPPITTSNWVPGFRIGGILEYDFKSGFGFFGDLGLEFLLDHYNGLKADTFPIDLNIRLGLGVIYHFKNY
ncbi:MAG: hypothetical protein II824_10550 [Bacteroidales bacterium]|nr:hypothetical protein [Bacteroidales bacterium]